MDDLLVVWEGGDTNRLEFADMGQFPCDWKSWVGYADLLFGKSKEAHMTTYPEGDSPHEITVTKIT